MYKRQGPHTTADDPTKYRTEADLEGPLHRDPMIRLEKYLREQGYADDAFFEEVAESAQKVASGVRDAVLSAEVADFEHFFDRVYADVYKRQAEITSAAMSRRFRPFTTFEMARTE